MSEVLGLRALSRATLERQLLLRRSDLPVLDAVRHLVGLQAQEPPDPYTALWSRLEGFDPGELGRLLEARQVVRLPLMRSTIHLVTADDCLALRPLVQPVLDAELARYRNLAGVDVDAVLAFGRELVEERPRSARELRAALAERFPAHDPGDLASACRNLLALVQVPPRGVWGKCSQVISTTAESWLGRPLEARPSLDELVLRYLGAFGPAAVADVAAWSRLTGLREVLERLRPRLRTFRDERGRELFDLPDAPRPEPDTPAPVRFLPEYDNVLLSYADRTRFVSDEQRRAFSRVEARVRGTVLGDGVVFGVWQREPAGPLVVSYAGRAARRALEAVEAEGQALLRLIEPDAETRVRFVTI